VNNGEDFPLPADKTISSDEIIVLEVQRSRELVIMVVTNDQALLRRLKNLFLPKIFIRICTEVWINFEANEEEAIKAFNNYFPLTKDDVKIIIDEGSYQTVLDNLGTPKGGPPKWNQDFKRGDPVYQEDLLLDMPPPLTFENQDLFRNLFRFFKDDFSRLRHMNNIPQSFKIIGLDGLPCKAPSKFEGI